MTALKCTICGKTSSENGNILKRCVKCKTENYCSRDCQKADWKIHKKVCAQKAAGSAASEEIDIKPPSPPPRPSSASSWVTASSESESESESESGSEEDEDGTWTGKRSTPASATGAGPRIFAPGETLNLDVNIDNPFDRLDSKTWLHGRSERDTFRLLIDTYRMRIEDEYVFTGNASTDCIYGGAPNNRAGFRKFINRALRKPHLLPSWWRPSKLNECIAFGTRNRDPNWGGLNGAMEKSDVVEYYGNPLMPMQLRKFGEQVYG